MTTFDQIAFKIIKEQEAIIGPLAWNEAQRVAGIKITSSRSEVVVENGDKRTILDQLVSRYEQLFGRASQEVCRHAAASLLADLPADQVPSSLR